MRSYRKQGAGPIDGSMPDFVELTGGLPFSPTVPWSGPVLDTRTHATNLPAEAADRIEWVARSHVAEIPNNQIATQWRAWEIARFQSNDRSVGIIEQIAIAIDDVWAWDVENESFVQVYNYGPQNGTRPTRRGLVHPNPLIAPLQWRFSLQAVNSSVNNNQPPLIVGSSAQQGLFVDQQWDDLFSGSDLEWGQNHQRVVPSATCVRLLAWFSGPTNYYSITVGGRLAGYSQGAITTQSALRNAITRH